jgi:ribosome-interacting GTPase 1
VHCRIHNADIHMIEDYDVDDLVDVIEGSRIYIPCIYVVNKIDQVGTCSGAGQAQA